MATKWTKIMHPLQTYTNKTNTAPGNAASRCPAPHKAFRSVEMPTRRSSTWRVANTTTWFLMLCSSSAALRPFRELDCADTRLSGDKRRQQCRLENEKQRRREFSRYRFPTPPSAGLDRLVKFIHPRGNPRQQNGQKSCTRSPNIRVRPTRLLGAQRCPSPHCPRAFTGVEMPTHRCSTWRVANATTWFLSLQNRLRKPVPRQEMATGPAAEWEATTARIL